MPPGVTLDVCGAGGASILDRSRDAGELTAAVITVAPGSSSLVIVAPIYSAGPPPDTVAQRRARLLGWAVAQFSAAGVLAGALDGTPRVAVSVARRDVIASGSTNTVFGPVTAVSTVGQMPHATLRSTVTVPADGQWILTVSGTPHWTGLSPDLQGILALIVGVFISLLVFAIVLLLARTRAKTEERLHAIFEHSPAAIFIRDRNARYVATNDAFDELLGIEPRSALGKTAGEVRFAGTTRTALAGDAQVLDGETVSDESVVQRSGVETVVSVLKFPLVDVTGRTYAVCGIVNDVTEERRMEEQVRLLTEFDPLTGLYNRAALIRELDSRLRQATHGGRSGAVLTFNLDQLKVVNDSYGHAAGDAVIKALAELLRSRTRDRDVVARLGGDELTAVLADSTGDGALAVARDVRALLADRPTGPPMTASVGVATFTGEGELTANDLLVQADLALYEAKQAGGDRVRVYTGESGESMSWVQRIRDALSDQRFVLYGQPIVCLNDGRVVLHELLIRMLAEDGSIIPPSDFLPAAERFGLIRQIDRWVTGQALALPVAQSGVAINLSAHSIGDRSIIAAVREAVADGLDPANVVFEITETAASSNLAAARLFAGTLNGIGCSVALDDFGTGFGSLTHLKHVPVQYLKIDMEFVRRMTGNETDRQIVQSIVGIARALGKQTVAEGVEDQATVDALRELGVDHIQGFFVGRPTRMSPPTAFEHELARDATPSNGRHPPKRSPAEARA